MVGSQNIYMSISVEAWMVIEVVYLVNINAHLLDEPMVLRVCEEIVFADALMDPWEHLHGSEMW